MANQILLLLWLLPSMMIGLVSSANVEKEKANYLAVSFSPPQAARVLSERRKHSVYESCYFTFEARWLLLTGKVSKPIKHHVQANDFAASLNWDFLGGRNPYKPIIKLNNCTPKTYDLIKDCKTTVEIRVSVHDDGATMATFRCVDTIPGSPKFIIKQTDFPVYDVARLGPSNQFTTVIASDILADKTGTKPSTGSAFMMKTDGEVIIKVEIKNPVGNSRRTYRTIEGHKLRFEPYKAFRNHTTLAFISLTGQIYAVHDYTNHNEESECELPLDQSSRWGGFDPLYIMTFSDDADKDGSMLQSRADRLRNIVDFTSIPYKPNYRNSAGSSSAGSSSSMMGQ